MDILLDIVLLIVGFALLVKGADVFVDGSVGIAQKLKIPSIIIGLTIVAMGTSLPEAVVSVTAAIKGSGDLAIGNVVGSNIFNLILIVGLCGLIKPFTVKVNEIAGDFWFSIAAAAALLAAVIVFGDTAEKNTLDSTIPRYIATILFVVFVFYIVILVRKALAAAKDGKASVEFEEDEEGDSKKPKPSWLLIIFVVVGCGLIIGGGQLTVSGAVSIAEKLGIPERIIGLTIVAIGTSLPELVTSLVAIKKAENAIALGNVVGSNIFNVLFVLGIAGSINPLSIAAGMSVDLIILIAVSLMTLLFIYAGKKINRVEGGIMVGMYGAYLTYLCINQ